MQKNATTTIVLTKGSTSGTVTTYDTTECGSNTVEVKSNGTLTIASNGAVTSNGAEVTVQLHRVVFVPITSHCIYKTNNTKVGALTEGVYPPVIHIGSSPIPEVATDGLCGNDALLTGTYTVTHPEGVLIVD